ncbi:MAG: hypothetical protein WC609_01100 [Candidatus Paceibacterota bacterium]|jgi:hypothetical protein
MEITLEEIQKKFETLPEDLKWAIMAAKVDDNIIEIGQTEGLNVEQMGQLSLETHMVMFGFTHPDKFKESVKNSMKLGDEKTQAVVNAVNEKILKEIRVKIMAMYNPAPETKNIQAEEEKNTEILNSAGIEVLPTKNTPTNDIGEKKLKEDVHTILAQKLSSSVQSGVARTEHTLENITKGSGPGVNSPTTPPVPLSPSSIMGNIKPASTDTSKLSPSYSIGEDPYRIKPE